MANVLLSFEIDETHIDKAVEAIQHGEGKKFRHTMFEGPRHADIDFIQLVQEDGESLKTYGCRVARQVMLNHLIACNLHLRKAEKVALREAIEEGVTDLPEDILVTGE